jgi:uncharacterized protein
MNLKTQSRMVDGPAGPIQCAIDEPELAPPLGVALVCHPHPQFGGTLDNKVVQTLARSFVQLGWRSVRFNFRGVGQSAGQWDSGVGELDDAQAVLQAFAQTEKRDNATPLALAGFSFGGYVASWIAQRLPHREQLKHLVLVGPAVANFKAAPVSADALVIQGEQDDVVPMGAVLDWARPQALPVTVVPGAGHFFHGQLGLLKQLVLRHCRP